MTHHDLISSYIDNELSATQEQEFLISLAANDNLRSSFRTELTLKNIVHRDESLITPPRALRASVFAAIGMGAALAPEVAQATTQVSASQAPLATSIATHASVATQSSSFFKTLFVTKLNALFTTLSLSVATLVGFVGHDLVVEEQATTQTIQPSTTTAQPQVDAVQNEVVSEKPVAESTPSNGSRIVTRRTTSKKALPTKSISSEAEMPQTDASSDPATSGTGEAEMDAVKFSSPKK